MGLKNRASRIRILHFLAVGLVLALPASARAQTVVATVTAGAAPEAVAVNTLTNKIYVANFLSSNVTVTGGPTREAAFCKQAR